MTRQTMTRTYLADAVAAGADVRAGVRVERLLVDDGRCSGVVVRDSATGRTEQLPADTVVVCGGAIQTPALLQRSGVRRAAIGRHLAVHPTVKVVARFAEEINDPGDVATYQVKEFGSWLSFGGSASGPSLLALHLADNWPAFGSRLADWRRSTSYYAAITSRGRGGCRCSRACGTRSSRTRSPGEDLDRPAQRAGPAAPPRARRGADAVYPSLPRGAVVRDATTCRWRRRADAQHGQRDDRAPLRDRPDGRRRVGRRDRLLRSGPWRRRLRVNDASLFPEAVGVNPQGTLMARIGPPPTIEERLR